MVLLKFVKAISMEYRMVSFMVFTNLLWMAKTYMKEMNHRIPTRIQTAHAMLAKGRSL